MKTTILLTAIVTGILGARTANAQLLYPIPNVDNWQGNAPTVEVTPIEPFTPNIIVTPTIPQFSSPSINSAPPVNLTPVPAPSPVPSITLPSPVTPYNYNYFTPLYY